MADRPTRSPPEGSPAEPFRRSLSRLHATARRRLVLHGTLALLGAAAASGGLAALALGGEDAPPVAIKAGLLASVAALLVAVAVVRLILPWRRLRDPAALSHELERGGGLGNLLVAAEEALRRRERWAGNPAVLPGLVDRLFAAAGQTAAGLRLGRRLPLPWVARTALGALAGVGLLLWLNAAAPQRVALGADRLLHPLRPENPVPALGLYLESGPAELVVGSDAVIAARDFGRARGGVTCEVRSGTGLWQAVPCRREGSGLFSPSVRWTARLPEVRESFAYRFGRDGMVTPAGAVTVVHPPLLAAWSATIRPPAYTGLPAQSLPQTPSRLQAPAGSRLVWSGAASHPIVAAGLVVAAGDTLPLQARGDSVRGETLLRDSFGYSVLLRDARGLTNGSRLRYEVIAIPDADPYAALARPGDDGLLPGEGKVDLRGRAGDDYGVARLDLLLRHEIAGGAGAADRGDAGEADAPRGAAAETSGWSRVTVWRAEDGGPVTAARNLEAETPWGRATVEVGPVPAGEPEQPEAPGAGAAAAELPPFALALDAGGLELLPGDGLLICLEAIDNRQPGPPGRGRSRVLRLALPSAAEMLTQQVEHGDERVGDLQEMRKRSQDLAADLERLDRELKKNPVTDWSRQQEVQAALERQKALQQELEKTLSQFQNDLSTMAQNNLNSPELLDKLQQVAELLREIHNADLDRLLERLRQAAASLSPEEVQRAMQEAARNQQEIAQRLDRAIALLKEMAREQEMEGLTSVAERLLREQQELIDAQRKPAESPPAEQDKGAKAPDAQAQADRQQALADEAQRLEEQLRETLDRLQKESAGDKSGANERMRQALQEALEKLRQQGPQQSMQEAAGKLRKQPSQAAAAEQEQAMRRLAALYHVLLQGQLDMQGMMQQFASANLRRLASDLLALSEQEEQVADRIPTQLHGVDSGDLTRRQDRIVRATMALRDRTQATGGQSPIMTQRLIDELEGLIGQLRAALGTLQQSAAYDARRETRASLGGMNRTVIHLLTAADMAGGGQGSGSSSSAMGMRLQQMAREQAGLNAMADQLQRELQEKGLSQEARARMERLQSDQKGLAGQARDLDQQQKQAPDGERVLGDLGAVAQDMEKIANDLGSGAIDDQTLARQERILSRLLDARNSIRKRDFSQRRESMTAKRLFQEQPGEGTPSGPQGGDAFRQRREPVEKAPPDYRDLVRRYFRALQDLVPPAGQAAPPAQPAPPAGQATPPAGQGQTGPGGKTP